jgi:hypothetical protein
VPTSKVNWSRLAHHCAARVRGRVPLEVVRRGRRESWAEAPPTERRALLAAVLPALEESAAAPVDTAEPLRWLLEQIGYGITLTQAGYLPLELVAAAFARYPHWYPIGKGPRSEADLFQLAGLHELARTHRLVTERLRTLKLSAAGRAQLTDHQLRQRTAALAWLGTTAAIGRWPSAPWARCGRSPGSARTCAMPSIRCLLRASPTAAAPRWR